ncbi:DEAD/DEAH box helicase family protein [Sporosarcina sp. GW1-11]|uniref:DEAD/DEAH box helicase family protein n=1 Tax=Sporosarcina sp. GW1-11 TaxID=2899126 RepID=UPI00294CC3B1|nr:DEAD/DEAH box helicase family protein [Sporosarcina sp. GW1-11]MDV6377753.1 DEAD/DEAH box helicase family protein [Sporosarcina sp. GW1-11]
MVKFLVEKRLLIAGRFRIRKEYPEIKRENGLRLPQFVAISAIRAHWATTNSPAKIVLPTGRGKSEKMYATIISERLSSTLIIVPSNLLREQIFEGTSHFGTLPKLKMISYKVIYPTTFLYKSKVEAEDERTMISALEEVNIIVSTRGMIKKCLHPFWIN